MSLAKKVIGATALITVARGITRLVALLAAPILTVQLGPQSYGVMALIYTVTSLGTVFGLMGIDFSYARNFFSQKTNDSQAIERFCWKYALLMALLAAATTTAIWFFLLAVDEAGNIYTSCMIGFLIWLGVINVMAETRRRLRGAYLRIAMAVVLSNLILTSLNILLATYWRHDFWPLLIGAVVGVAFNILFLGLPGIWSSTKQSPLPGKQAWSVVTLGLPGVFSALMYWVMSASDRWFIAAFADQGTVGIYSFSSNIASVGLMLNGAITLSWFPEASRVYEQNPAESRHSLGRLWSRLVAALMLVWLGVTSFGGELLRLLADHRFHSGAMYIPWLASGVFFYGLSSLANTGLMLTKNMKPAAFWWCIAGCCNLIANYFVVPKFGALGAAWVNGLSFAIPVVTIMTVSQKRFPMAIAWRALTASTILLIAFGWVMAQPWHEQSLISGGLKLIPYLLAVTIVMRLTAPDWFKRVLMGKKA